MGFNSLIQDHVLGTLQMCKSLYNYALFFLSVSVTSLSLLFLFWSLSSMDELTFMVDIFILLSSLLDECDINEQVLPLVEDVLGFAALSISLLFFSWIIFCCFLMFPISFFSFVNLLFSHLYHQFCFRDQLHVIFGNTPSQFICVVFHKLFPYFMFPLVHFFFLLKFNFFFFRALLFSCKYYLFSCFSSSLFLFSLSASSFFFCSLSSSSLLSYVTLVVATAVIISFA